MRYLLIILSVCSAFTVMAQARKPVKKLPPKYIQVSPALKYRVLKTHTTNKDLVSDTNSFILAHYRLSLLPKDSVLLETFKKNKPSYIPVSDPAVGSIIKLLQKKDSVEIIINADTFFYKGFNQAPPAFVKPNSSVRFLLKVVDIMSAEALKEQAQIERAQLAKKDSADSRIFLAKHPDMKQTPEGVYYSVLKEGNGKAVKTNNRVSVHYKGMFLNGEVFDKTTGNTFNVNVGSNEVISGWESMLVNMHEGEKVLAVIPWTLAYGEAGQGVITPMTTLLFEIEVVKIHE